ncbi:hypothetical protein CDD82_4566 [Ophiocordyceps australis]|uniref:Uncharacterized protein n=1 Tax=Ophiocordyceps australis TaxID=1399860 RepID=A0A2C5YAN9_9HYPO|nr:hypothetical protein CDD82_4566 [Ophiocordyceps australis]
MELAEPQDWRAWISYIQGVACLNGTWDYIDPRGSKQLEKPARPQMPRRPALNESMRREKDESNIDFQARLQVYKYGMDIIMGEYNLAQDCHRLDCLEFSIKLEEYAAAKKEMNKVNDLIFKTVDKRWIAQLAGSGIMTPRDHLQKLESLLGHAASHAKDPVSQLLRAAQDKGHSDWQSWAHELRKLNAQCLEMDPTASYNYDVMDSFLSTVRSDFEEFYDRWATMVGSGRNVDAGRSTISVMFEDVLGNFLKTSLYTGFLPSLGKPRYKETDGPSRNTVHERVPSPSPSTSVRSDRPYKSHENKNKGLSAKLCPGCNQVHPIRGGNWWENCWVYLDICGKKPAPKWYDMTPQKIDRVKRRMRENPAEQMAADKWLSEQAAS